MLYVATVRLKRWSNSFELVLISIYGTLQASSREGIWKELASVVVVFQGFLLLFGRVAVGGWVVEERTDRPSEAGGHEQGSEAFWSFLSLVALHEMGPMNCAYTGQSMVNPTCTVQQNSLSPTAQRCWLGFKKTNKNITIFYSCDWFKYIVCVGTTHLQGTRLGPLIPVAHLHRVFYKVSIKRHIGPLIISGPIGAIYHCIQHYYLISTGQVFFSVEIFERFPLANVQSPLRPPLDHSPIVQQTHMVNPRR